MDAVVRLRRLEDELTELRATAALAEEESLLGVAPAGGKVIDFLKNSNPTLEDAKPKRGRPKRKRPLPGTQGSDGVQLKRATRKAYVASKKKRVNSSEDSSDVSD